MTPSSGRDDLERRLTAMLNARAAAISVEPDVEGVFARTSSVGQRQSRRAWMLAAATIVMVSLGLVALGATREPDGVQNHAVEPSVASSVEATPAPTVTEPAAPGAPGDGLVIVAANPPGLEAGQNGDLYLLVPGEAPRRIVGTPEDGVAQHCPQLSSDGRFLAWGEGTATGTTTSYRGVWPVVDRAVVVAPVTRNGTVSEPIVRVSIPDGSGELTCPSWSPDGAAIAYRVDGDVWITDSGDGTTDVVDAESVLSGSDRWSMAEVAWSNDGRRIAASERGQVRIIDVATGTSHVRDTGPFPRHLMWLPNDQEMIFSTTDASGDHQDIVVASVDGTGAGESIFGSLPPPGPNEFYQFASPTLSPDGTSVAVLRNTISCAEDDSGGCSWGPTQLLVVDLTTFTVTLVPLPDEGLVSTVRWSPDGQRVLLSSLTGVVAVPLDGRGPTVTFATGADILLEWTHGEITWWAPS